MGTYAGRMKVLALQSPLANEIPKEWSDHHIKFVELYDLVRSGRNDALHQGAVARSLTSQCVQLALILEDALKMGLSKVRHFMVQEPVRAEHWQPLSLIRQQMLENAFTQLPAYLTIGEKGTWTLVSDYWVARYLGTEPANRKARLATTLQDAFAASTEPLGAAGICFPDTPISDALLQMQGKPLLVIDEEFPDHLLGIITPFDVM